MVRKELAAHLQQQQALLSGYTEFLQRGAATLLSLCLSRPPPAGEALPEGAVILAAEVDRAALLLAPLADFGPEDGGSPMDATPTPFTGVLAGFNLAGSGQIVESSGGPAWLMVAGDVTSISTAAKQPLPFPPNVN